MSDLKLDRQRRDLHKSNLPVTSRKIGPVSHQLGHVVVRECDNLVESYIVHSPLIGQVERYYVGSLAMFLIFLTNVPYT
jgi:hypothetical protein